MKQLTFLSTSRQCFTSLVCPETVVLSMLFDKNLTVPDIASAVQLEERTRPKVANPYNTLALRKQAKEKKVDKKPEQVWEPHVQVGRKVASDPVSQFCFEPDPLFTDRNVVINLQKTGPVEPPSPPPVPSASPLPQLQQPASSMSEGLRLWRETSNLVQTRISVTAIIS
jgi:hypothetical protein